MSAQKLPQSAETLDPRGSDLLRLDAARRIDAVCERFEQALQADRPMTIESCLAESAGDGLESAVLLRELLSLELEYRLRRGERPAPDEYLPRFRASENIVELAFLESAATQAEAIPSFLVDHPRYRVERLLGSGGMGSVYLAEHRALERDVALKVINPELLSDPGMVERFRREAKAAARLSHANVVTVYDAEAAQGASPIFAGAKIGTVPAHLLVMEYVPGADLARTVVARGPLPVAAACDYVAQAARGLQHAHEHGMVHRDITPRNLMLTGDGRVKILDFGLAYFVSEAQTIDRLASPRLLLGSIDYMSPEQAADPHSADIRADVYSLGCTLYFLLTGQPPFPGGTLAEKIESHASEPPPVVGGVRDDVPAGLSQAIGRMLAKSPADRFQTPAEVAAALAPFAAAAGATRESSRGSRQRWIAAAVVALLCGLLLAGWIARWNPFRSAVEIEEQSAEAQQLYHEGVYMLGQRRESRMKSAIERLQGAVELAPDFARAYAALADAYNLSGDYGWEKPDEVFPKAKQAAEKALSLNDKLAEAHLAMAFALDSYDGDSRGAEQEFLRAIELDPKLPAAHHWYAWFLVQQGRPEEAAKQIAEAQKLRPDQKLGPDQVVIVNNAGKIAYLSRDYPLAIEKYKHALELSPEFRKAHRDLALVYAETGKLEQALAEVDRGRGVTTDGRDLDCVRAYAYARNGHSRQARDLLGRLERLADEKPLAYEIAAVYSALGEKDRAFAWLHRAFNERAAGRGGIGVDPRFDGLRSDPRFHDFDTTKEGSR
jgi:serine/threonine protein kinase/lipoprotein NlpI